MNDFNGMIEGNTPFEDSLSKYIFSVYWTFTTLTTVGYGDYSGGTTREYCVSLAFEFVGFCFNAVLITVMSSFFSADMTFDDLLDARLSQLDLWMKRIELSNYPDHMHP